MARIRSIKAEFFLDAVVASLEPLARLAFIGLWNHADREGRLEDKPEELRVKILPYDNCNMDGLLDALAKAGRIQRYEVGGRKYISVVNFAKHQVVNVREAASAIPGPPALEHLTSTCVHVKENASYTAAPLGREGKGKEECREVTPSPSRPNESPPLLVFETAGRAKTWDLTEAFASELAAAFPAIDVLAECRRALVWTQANPRQKKTAEGMPRFLFSWLGRTNDRGPRRAEQHVPPAPAKRLIAPLKGLG